MANPKVDIDIYAHDKTKGAIDSATGKLSGIKSGFEQLTGISLDAAGKIGLITAAVSGIYKYTKDAVIETQKYGEEISTLSYLTGQPMEDLSRFAQAAKLFGVDYKTLTSALSTATKNGVDISIESLLELADEYNSMKDPIDRAKLLTETFGAAGPEMANIFKRGTDDIIDQMDKVGEALVWDEEKQAALDEYNIAVGTLKQTFEELKIKVGMEVIPILTEFLKILNGEGKITLGMTQEEVQVLNDKFGGLANTWGNITIPTSDETTDAIKRQYDAVGVLGANIKGLPSTVGVNINVDAHFSQNALTAMDLFGHGGGGRARDLALQGNSLQQMRAYGGPVQAHVPYIVGEKGPELIIPQNAGRVVPNNQLQGGADFDYARLGDEIVGALMRSGYVR